MSFITDVLRKVKEINEQPLKVYEKDNAIEKLRLDVSEVTFKKNGEVVKRDTGEVVAFWEKEDATCFWVGTPDKSPHRTYWAETRKQAFNVYTFNMVRGFKQRKSFQF